MFGSFGVSSLAVGSFVGVLGDVGRSRSFELDSSSSDFFDRDPVPEATVVGSC